VRGPDLLDALIVAVDAATVLGMMARTPMRFFRPAMCGALGASLGLSRLAGLDEETSRRALGLTYCQLSGNMQSHVEGTPGLALQIGFNARAAVGAHELALAGMAGPVEVIDGPFGYLKLIEQEYDTRVLEQLGQHWQIEQVSHKPFPTGRAAHAALDGLDQLLAAGLDPDDIERIELHAPPLIRRLIDRPARRGMSASYARLCLPWLVSVRLRRGRVGLEDFSATALADPERWCRVDCVKVLPDANPDPNALVPQSLSVVTRSGQRHEIKLPVVLGSPRRPLDEAARTAKAQACWRYGGLDDERGSRLLAELRALADRDSLDALFHLLTPATGPA
jgi:2-methylcitrate dehydratase PrpD